MKLIDFWVMNKQKYIYLFLSIISITVIFSWFNTKKKTGVNEKFQQDKEMILTNRIKELYSIKKEKLNPLDLNNFNDSSFNSIEERLRKSSQLILFVPEEQCGDCVTAEYEKMKLLQGNIQDNIVLITNFSKTRDLKLWINSKKIDYPVYNVGHFFLDEINQSRQIALFLLDSTLVLQHLFIPISFMPELSDEYYEFIENYSEKVDNDLVLIQEAEVEINETKHDFGKLTLNELASTKFEILNISSSPVVISDIKTTCGCTVTEWSKDPINKGEKTYVKVDFKADKYGVFSKKIFVYSNSQNSPHHLMITGRVVECPD